MLCTEEWYVQQGMLDMYRQHGFLIFLILEFLICKPDTARLAELCVHYCENSFGSSACECLRTRTCDLLNMNEHRGAVAFCVCNGMTLVAL